ncbi:hypothetical protein OJ997_03265 [Solirubrobacter phytolaccae]|uniref:Uncharacterized protein n=1 Tax=Solirubrobacter phytolaccae TaxID=1404360 RepID=A0A9X3N3R2_9ACTN|nr:hypothetical protein [Solirubrobacter phytolaccae]MDA0179305.1 hypothetical protein [Solirubrobacter phytolaccae]
MAVPVATAGAHSADFMFTGDVAQQIGAYQGGAGMFMQRAPDTPGALTLVGHEPLESRGMNAAIAVNKGFVYVGSRTDGSAGRQNAGIMVVDARNPAQPKIAAQMKPPLEGNPQESSRELRVWRSQDVLIVLHTNCGGTSAHLCAQPSRSSMRFYDIKGENATNPKLLHQNTRDTHEFFIWEDPKNPKRALMFEASAGSQLAIYDLSPLLNADEATRAPVRLFQGAHGFGNSNGSGIHSFSVSNDGTKAYFALLTRGFGVVDVSDFTDTDPATNTYRTITPTANRPTWPGPGAHSAIKLWNKDSVYVSDEVYGTATGNGHGCPWGWTRFIDIKDETKPVVVGEYRLAENQPLSCTAFNPSRTSYSAHNPTLTPNIAFSTWHSGGVQAMNISDPTNVTQLAEYKPRPLASVGDEDPRLSSDTLPDRTDNKVVMWSYPVIEDGLIYVVDLRNGLYILKYTGPFQQEVDDVKFLEGNSNQGDALCFEPVPGAALADCSTSAEGTAGGSVPATLSLTLGAPGTFGTFLPGTTLDYFAKTDAKVISTAGAALLTAADISTVATGHLVNDAFSLPQPVQVRATNSANPASAYAPVGSANVPTPLLSYTAPVSNDEVTFDFKQSIASTDALRTGAYSKLLTFTLSTTTP